MPPHVLRSRSLREETQQPHRRAYLAPRRERSFALPQKRKLHVAPPSSHQTKSNQSGLVLRQMRMNRPTRHLLGTGCCWHVLALPPPAPAPEESHPYDTDISVPGIVTAMRRRASHPILRGALLWPPVSSSALARRPINQTNTSRITRLFSSRPAFRRFKLSMA